MWRSWLACVLTVVAPVTAAQVFECTNAGGVKQYAQFCPPGTVQQRQIGTGSEGGSGAANPAGAAPKSIELQDAEFRQRMQERKDAETKAGQEKSQAEQDERNCLDARTQLQAVEDGQRMMRFDPETGESVPYGDDERAAASERLRNEISQRCK